MHELQPEHDERRVDDPEEHVLVDAVVEPRAERDPPARASRADPSHADRFDTLSPSESGAYSSYAPFNNLALSVTTSDVFTEVTPKGQAGGSMYVDNIQVSAAVPEPTAGLLLGLGLLGVAVRRRV